MSSFYGKVDERDHVMLEARRKTRKRIAIIAVSLVVLAGIVIGAVFGTMAHNMKPFGESHLKNSTEMTSNALAIITWLGKIDDSFKLPRRLLTTADVKVDSRMNEQRYYTGIVPPENYEGEEIEYYAGAIPMDEKRYHTGAISMDELRRTGKKRFLPKGSEFNMLSPSPSP